MSASVISSLAIAQALALTRGTSAGATNSQSLRVLDDKATLPVGAPSVATATDYIRFGKLPKGANIIPHLSRLTTDHTAAIAGKLQLVPLDGGAAVDIASVTVQVEALAVAASGNSETLSIENGSVLDNIDSVNVASDSWIQFVPAGDLTIASTAKVIRARIVYGQIY